MKSTVARSLSRSLPTTSLATTSVGSKRFFRSDLLGSDVYRWQKKDDLAYLRAMEYIEPKPSTVKVAVTGCSGNIGYALLFRLARYAFYILLLN